MFHLRRARCAVLLSFAGLLCVSHHDCSPQSLPPLGVLSGTVIDSSGALIPHAAISVQGTTLTRSVYTDGRGRFFFSLPTGAYQLSISAPDFAPYTSTFSIASAATTLHLEIRLMIAGRPEEIVVPIEDPAGTSASNNASALIFQGADLAALSNDDATFQRELSALAGGGFGSHQPSFIVDGFTGGRVPPKTSILSVRINRNPYSAAYDSLGFGRVEITTKPGADKFHGQLNINATDSPFNALNPYITGTPPPYYILNLDVNLSGPINRKTSFFLSGVFNDQQSNAALNAITATNGQPTPYSLAVRDPLTTSTYGLRLDRQITATNVLTARYEFNQINQTNGGLISPLTLASQAFDSGFTTQTLRFVDTQSVGMHFVSETHLQYIRSRQRQDALTAAPTLLVEGAFNGGGNPAQSLRDNQDNLELQEQLSIDRGAHYLRFGARYRLTRESNLSTANFNGQYVFPSIASYIANTPSQYSQTLGQKSFSLLTGDLGAYAEDEWKVTKSITLDLGFRLESESAIPDHLDMAPRFGAAWALRRKNQKAAFLTLRGGAGIFYNRFATANIFTTVRQNGTSQQTFYLGNPCYNPGGPPPTTAPCPALTSAPPTPYRIAPNFKAEYGWISGVTAEKHLGKIGTASVNYVAIRGVHQSASININAPLPGTYNPANPNSGTRPLGGSQNIYEFASNGISKAQVIFFNTRLNLTKHANIFVSYTVAHQNQDITGATTFASNSYNVSQDYGRAPQPTQQLFTGGTLHLPLAVDLNAFASVDGGVPFNITTGTDLNGDTLYNDRPAFATRPTAASVLYKTSYGTFDANPQPGESLVPINYGNSANFSFLELSATRSFQFGARPPEKGPATPVAAPGTKPAARPDPPYTVTFTVDSYNIFNAHNPGQPVGVLSSPYFGQSVSLSNPFGTNTAANRIVYLQAQFSF